MRTILILMSAVVFTYNLWKLQLIEDGKKEFQRNLVLFTLSSIALIMLGFIR